MDTRAFPNPPISDCSVSTRRSFFSRHVAVGGRIIARPLEKLYGSVRSVLTCSGDMAAVRRVEPLQIAIVGDMHDDWGQEDMRAIKKIQPDLVLFVGDFGESCEEIAEMVGGVPIPKAAILGNHDYWPGQESVQRQVKSLGEANVGYGRVDFPSLKLSIVGGRPGSRGGDEWGGSEGMNQTRDSGIRNFKESTKKILEAVSGAPEDHFLIFMGHNGPSGLGDKCHSICGKDWPKYQSFPGGDHGDPDFAEALDCTFRKGRNVPAVVFGHMHHKLHSGNPERIRKMLEIKEKTHYINAAIVPRVRRSPKIVEGSKRGKSYHDIRISSERHFVIMEIDPDRKIVVRVRDIWVRVDENVEIVESVDRYKEENLDVNSEKEIV